MATGIVAVGLDLAGFPWATRVLLAVTAALWTVMAVTFGLRLRGDREGRRAARREPVSLTTVAGSGVLGVGLLLFRHEMAAEALLALMAVAWLLAGALSISALACAKLAAAAGAPAPPPLEALMLVILAAAFAWYLLLACAEAARPRTGYDGRRWSTVFPLGMTAAAAMTAGTVSGLHWLDVLGRVLLWPALAAWSVVAVGAVRHAAASRTSA
ncbi:SLAC1 family transporter [Actinomadura montaniterrae]|nr:hypothetical protein [Actinomadura montaniterrae]